MPITLLEEMVRQLAEWLTVHINHPALDDGPSLISTSGRHEWLRVYLEYARWAVEDILDAEDPHAAALQARTAVEGMCLTLEGDPPFGGLGAYLDMLEAIITATAPATRRRGLPIDHVRIFVSSARRAPLSSGRSAFAPAAQGRTRRCRMVAKVFHAQGPGARWPDDFVLVAEVERCSDPDMAFRVVQHFGDSHWARGLGVRCLVPEATARSTMPGDVVELNGELLECLPGTGWRRLE